jgi:hypothetical protein
MMAPPIHYGTLAPTMTASIRHRYAPADTAADAACRICGQRPSWPGGFVWHERESATPSVARWQMSEGVLIWWHTSLGDQPVVLPLRRLN